MAISRTTDWSKKRYIMYVTYFVSELLAVSIGFPTRQKRSLFREQLLPHRGGKIPDGAFSPERLILNKFSQNGLYSTDGFYLEQRHPNRQHSHKRYLPNTLKINRPVDNRYVAAPGRYHHSVEQVDTTYLEMPPVEYVLHPPNYRYNPLPQLPHLSLYLVRLFKGHSRIDEENRHKTVDEIFKESTPYLERIHALK